MKKLFLLIITISTLSILSKPVVADDRFLVEYDSAKLNVSDQTRFFDIEWVCSKCKKYTSRVIVINTKIAKVPLEKKGAFEADALLLSPKDKKKLGLASQSGSLRLIEHINRPHEVANVED